MLCGKPLTSKKGTCKIELVDGECRVHGPQKRGTPPKSSQTRPEKKQRIASPRPLQKKRLNEFSEPDIPVSAKIRKAEVSEVYLVLYSSRQHDFNEMIHGVCLNKLDAVKLVSKIVNHNDAGSWTKTDSSTWINKRHESLLRIRKTKLASYFDYEKESRMIISKYFK